jgi:hypothetical protein
MKSLIQAWSRTKEGQLTRRITTASLVLGGCLLLLMTATARAGEVDDVNSKLWSIWQDKYTPIILNDSNWSLYEIVKDLDGDGTNEIVIMGFIDFGDDWETGTGTIPPGKIRSISGTTPSVDPDASPAVELTGWFAGVVIGGSSTLPGVSPETASTDPHVYLGAVPDGTSFDVDGDGIDDWTWNPDGSGTMVQLWADSANNFSTGVGSPLGLFPKATDGTKVVELGYKGTPADGSETGGTAYGAGTEYYALQFESFGSGTATDFYASLNSVWTLGSSLFTQLGANDTGNNFYATGSLTLLGSGPWKYTGEAEARIILLPLPSGALAGLALLGLLGFGRQIRRKKSL